MPYYLGLDCSTQSFTAILIEVEESRRDVVYRDSVLFDRDLPHYRTHHGVLPSPDPGAALSPPAMWAEALDVVMARLARAGLDLARLSAVAGSAQQHGTVYVGHGARGRLSSLESDRPLAEQLAGVFSRTASPIWMDSTTGPECEAITTAVGGAAALARVTGSRAFPRFAGPQIRRFAKTEPESYGATRRVHLVSSFLASLLIGGDAPLDPGDASGMNLMELATGTWWPPAVEATAPELERRLPAIVPSDTVIGRISRFWRARYGFPDCGVVAWSGDNPCSLIGTGLVEEGPVAVSLGTSDTIFGLMREPRVDPSGEGHVFGAPTGDFMALTCFRNGSLAREAIRDAAGLDWAGFSLALQATPPGNGGALMLPWFEPEITPAVERPGARRLRLDPLDHAANVRAVVEGQMMAMANHSVWMGVRISRIRATGGGSNNPEILQVMADVFDAEVQVFETSNSACLGAAIRAAHADLAARRTPVSWAELTRDFVTALPDSRIGPRPDAVRTYAALRHGYAAFEAAER